MFFIFSLLSWIFFDTEVTFPEIEQYAWEIKMGASALCALVALLIPIIGFVQYRRGTFI